jgi:hypothetical protein
VEAYYFNDDPHNIYIAVITSFPPPPGYNETRISGSTLVVSGDLALDFGVNGAYSGTDPFNYDFGININNEVRHTSGNATSGGGAVGVAFYQTANSDWYTGTPTYASYVMGVATNFDPNYSRFSGDYLGAATVSYYQYNFPNGWLEGGFPTYVIEATIPKNLFPKGFLEVGDFVGISWVEGCRNDGNNIQGILRFAGAADIYAAKVPEPITLILYGLGFAGAGLYRRLRRPKMRRPK